MPSNALYRTPESVMNALSGPQGPMGMNPNVNRLSLLPRYNRRDGLIAPQWLYDLARAAEAPGNALMGHQTTPEEALNFAGNIAGAGLGSSAMMRSPAPGPGRTVAATVYHGSPHDFDRFDMSKIGTGEGAQAYGHGLYVAESPGVAKQYQTQLASGEPLLNGAPLSSVMDSLPISDEAKKILAYNLKAGPADPARVERFAKQGIPEYQEAWSVLQKTTPNKGKMYSVDLPDSAISNMLDWDAPLSQQPEQLKKLVDAGILKRAAPPFEDRFVSDKGILIDPTSPNNVQTLINQVPDNKFSERLRAAGIPGIRYFDGGSRPANITDARLLSLLEKHGNDTKAAVDEFMRSVYNTPKAKEALRKDLLEKLKPPTRNFVVFDDKLLKILNKE